MTWDELELQSAKIRARTDREQLESEVAADRLTGFQMLDDFHAADDRGEDCKKMARDMLCFSRMYVCKCETLSDLKRAI